MSDESADKTQPGPYSDKSGTDNTQYGNIAQIKADLFELKQAVADLEAKTEPLQSVTNSLNVVVQLAMDFDGLRQRMGALSAKILEMDGRYQTKLGALEQRINTLFGDGGVAAFVEDRIKIALGVIDQRLDAMDKMGKVGQ